MRGLLLKDILMLKSYTKSLVIFIVLFTLIGIINKEFGLMLPIMCVLMCSMSSIATFSYDHLAKWDKFSLTLPFTRKDIVKSKYILTMILMMLGSLLGILLTIIVSHFTSQSIVMKDILATSVGVLLGVSIITCLQIPFIYKYGPEKGRIHIYLVAVLGVFIIGGIVFLVEKSGINIQGMLLQIVTFIAKYWFLITPIVFILVQYISYRVSYRIFKTKEV